MFVVTNRCRVQICNLVKGMYETRSINDFVFINSVTDSVIEALENVEDDITIIVNNQQLFGRMTPLAELYTRYQSIEKDGVRCTMTCNSSIALFSNGQETSLITVHHNIIKQDGCCTERDWIKEDVFYTATTKKDFDGIYDTMYKPSKI